MYLNGYYENLSFYILNILSFVLDIAGHGEETGHHMSRCL